MEEPHKCKYCGTETTQPDEECYAKPKQETLEEFIKEELQDEFFTNISEYKKAERFIQIGAEWQQERMYSEEEIRKIAEEVELAILFHNTYERLAPKFGYETRLDTKSFDSNTPNGMLMIAVCKEIIKWQAERSYSEEEVRNLIIEAISSCTDGLSSWYQDFDEWFEQNKKTQ